MILNLSIFVEVEPVAHYESKEENLEAVMNTYIDFLKRAIFKSPEEKCRNSIWTLVWSNEWVCEREKSTRLQGRLDRNN